MSLQPSPSTITTSGITYENARNTPHLAATPPERSHTFDSPGLLLRLRSRAWSGIPGCDTCAPRTISPSIVVAENPLVQQGSRINNEARDETSISRRGVSVQCIAKNGLDFLRARFALSEFRTVGEIIINKALVAAGTRRDSDSDTPWTTPRRARATSWSVSSSYASITNVTCPCQQRTTHALPFATSALVRSRNAKMRSSPTPKNADLRAMFGMDICSGATCAAMMICCHTQRTGLSVQVISRTRSF